MQTSHLDISGSAEINWLHEIKMLTCMFRVIYRFGSCKGLLELIGFEGWDIIIPCFYGSESGDAMGCDTTPVTSK